MFAQNAPLYSTEIDRKEGETTLYINYLGANFVPSLADNAEVMGRTIDALSDNPQVSRIIFVQQRNYHYGFEQVSLLAEIAQLYNFLIKQERILSPEKLSLYGAVQGAHEQLTYLMLLLRQDPIGCFVEFKRLIRVISSREKEGHYVRFLERIQDLLEKTRLIFSVKDVLDSNVFGDRALYGKMFRADVMPNFTFTRLVAQLPEDAELVDQYQLEAEDDTITVTILKKRNDTGFVYHILPPDYTLSEEHHYLLNLGRGVLIEHQPKAEEFIDAERTRAVFFNVARDLLQELARNKNMPLTYRELQKLARILVRQTIGFGLIEVLLLDNRLQDIFLNAPIAQNPVFVRHEEYGECVTNIIPSYEDAESWAAKLRLQSGRPLDEANPILDTDLLYGKVRARVAAIQRPLSPSGIAYAIRRPRDEPWTLPLFVGNKMMNSFTAGLLSFLIDGARTLLIAGTRSSGKTSLLGALLLEIMPSCRVLVVEDSVTKDARMIIKEKGIFRKITIGELIDERIIKNGFIDIDGREKELNSDSLEVFSVDKNGRVVLSKASKFIRHKVNKQIYEVKTHSGKKIKVTEDHSLFTLDEKNIMKPIKPKDMKEDDFLAIPMMLPLDNHVSSINLLSKLDKMTKNLFIEGKGIKDYFTNNRREVFALGYSAGYSKSSAQGWMNKGFLPKIIFDKLKDKLDQRNLFIKSDGISRKIPTELNIDEDLLNFVGLWLADGCYDKNSVIVSVMEEENKEVVRRIASRFNTEAKLHSDKFSSMINSVLLKDIMQNILELNGDAYSKKIPSWVYNLSDKQIGWLLKGFFSGDGCASDKEVVFSSCSKELISDMTSLLLRFGIVSRTNLDLIRPDKTFNCRIGATKMIIKFRDSIGFLVKEKRDKLDKLCNRISTHDTSDIIPLSIEVKEELSEILGDKFSRHDYITRQNNVGREQLNKLLEIVPEGITNPIDPLRLVVKSDLFWDRVKSVEKVDYEGYVYDISVPDNENFICENIVAHNTLELPVDNLRKLGYNVQRMKVRSALTESTTEIEASEGIRASLRLGDSALIVGEVRSSEAKSLYEAMRVGALANVVAGTIHGASPYGVFDRLVNDLGVPVTSFKATDVVLVANPIKTPDGLHSIKRVVQLAEVRKHWTRDPLEEKGFVDLLRYNVDKDELEPTDELINGESEIVKAVASGVKGWAGNWDAVYDNILLRGMIKQEIVQAAKKFNKPILLEALFNLKANEMFHIISDKVTREKGLPLSKDVFPLWKQWLYEKVDKW